eukprot:Phypoly_transcript_07460.p1 GENE.Phypoly_transcript_07460~~Phypoly_transcript_07460.p1  ORF type:complete len:450 (+),score=53.66 Phypoly_transcript_07460:246-1595(+)
MAPFLILLLVLSCFSSHAHAQQRIMPWLNLWDGWTNVEALAPKNTVSASAGVDVAMQNIAGLNSPVNGASREYLGIQNFTWTNTSSRANTADTYLGTRRVLICFWLTNNAADHYSNKSFNDTIHGKRDADIIGAIQSLPIGNKRPATGEIWSFYFAWEHEPDTYIGDNSRALYVQAVQYAITLSIKTAQGMGAIPYEFGTGGLLTAASIGKANMDGFDWTANLSDDVINSGMVVWFEDTYFTIQADPKGMKGTDGKTYSCQNFTSKVESHVAVAKAARLTRFVIGETACALSTSFTSDIVGVPAMMIPWLDEIEQWLQTEGEGVSTFSKANGTASHNGEITGDALKNAAYMCKTFNRPMRRPVVLNDTSTTAAPAAATGSSGTGATGSGTGTAAGTGSAGSGMGASTESATGTITQPTSDMGASGALRVAVAPLAAAFVAAYLFIYLFI